jgi:hypothetical protein
MAMDEEKKPSNFVKALKILGGCAVTLFAVAVLLPVGETAMHNVNMGLLKGTEDDPAAQKSPGGASAENELDCGADYAKQLAAQVASKNPPEQLLAKAAGENFSMMSNQAFRAKEKACDDAWEAAKSAKQVCDATAGVSVDGQGQGSCNTPGCGQAADACFATYEKAQSDHGACAAEVQDDFDKAVKETKAGAVYTLQNVRLESRDATTGAVVCNSTIHADLPQNLGSAEEEVSYRLEKMEDGGVHIEMTGLQ